MVSADEEVEICPKMVWGLYCNYICIGLVNGFFGNFIVAPIALSVFHATQTQMTVATSGYTLPWNLKLYLALFMEGFSPMIARRCPAFGRRKGWIIWGWVLSMGMLLVLAFLAPGLAKEDAKGFGPYSFLLMGVCFAFMFCDVSGDGMSMELSKFEPAEKRGYILATGQLYRFIANFFSNGLGFFINGKFYNNNPSDAFGFELSFAWIHIVLIFAIVPFFCAMIYLLKDPPPPRKSENATLNEAHGIRGVWKVVQSFAVFMLILNNLFNITLAGFANPATAGIQDITSVSTLMTLSGNMVGMGLFSIGVYLFRTYFMNVNWRFTLFWTNCFNVVNILLFLPMIHNWGGLQNGWCISIAPSILQIIVGIAQVLTSLAVVEISPPGMEATIYEFLTQVHNAAITLNTIFSSDIIEILNLGDFNNRTTYMERQEYYNRQMDTGTLIACIICGVGIVLASLTLPKDKAMCHTWLNKAGWNNAWVGIFNLVLAMGLAWFALVRTFQKLFHS